MRSTVKLQMNIFCWNLDIKICQHVRLQSQTIILNNKIISYWLNRPFLDEIELSVRLRSMPLRLAAVWNGSFWSSFWLPFLEKFRSNKNVSCPKYSWRICFRFKKWLLRNFLIDQSGRGKNLFKKIYKLSTKKLLKFGFLNIFINLE